MTPYKGRYIGCSGCHIGNDTTTTKGANEMPESGYYWAIEMETADVPLSGAPQIIYANTEKGLAFTVGQDFPQPLKEFQLIQKIERPIDLDRLTVEELLDLVSRSHDHRIDDE